MQDAYWHTVIYSLSHLSTHWQVLRFLQQSPYSNCHKLLIPFLWQLQNKAISTYSTIALWGAANCYYISDVKDFWQLSGRNVTLHLDFNLSVWEEIDNRSSKSFPHCQFIQLWEEFDTWFGQMSEMCQSEPCRPHHQRSEKCNLQSAGLICLFLYLMSRWITASIRLPRPRSIEIKTLPISCSTGALSNEIIVTVRWTPICLPMTNWPGN